jgi:hypothetical protein
MDFNVIVKIFKLLMKEMEVSKWNHIMKILWRFYMGLKKSIIDGIVNT